MGERHLQSEGTRLGGGSVKVVRSAAFSKTGSRSMHAAQAPEALLAVLF